MGWRASVSVVCVDDWQEPAEGRAVAGVSTFIQYQWKHSSSSDRGEAAHPVSSGSGWVKRQMPLCVLLKTEPEVQVYGRGSRLEGWDRLVPPFVQSRSKPMVQYPISSLNLNWGAEFVEWNR